MEESYFGVISFCLFVWLTGGLPWWLSGLESACSAGDSGDTGSVPGLGRSPVGGNGNPLQHFCLENPMNRGAWWATVHRVAKSQTQLKRLSTHQQPFIWGFSGGSDSKVSACNAGDPDLIPRLGRSPGKEMVTHSSILPGESHEQRSLVGYSPWGLKESDMTEQLSTLLINIRALGTVI